MCVVKAESVKAESVNVVVCHVFTQPTSFSLNANRLQVGSITWEFKVIHQCLVSLTCSLSQGI